MIIGIGACDLAGGVGFNNDLPWPRLRHDMKRFKALTSNEIVIMGRKTWESLGCKPLKGRFNIVVTSNAEKLQKEFDPNRYSMWPKETGAPEFLEYDSLQDYVDLYTESGYNIYIIGGAALWKAFESSYDVFYITRVLGYFPADVVMDVKSIKRELPCVLYTSSVKREGHQSYYYEAWGRKNIV